MGFSRGRNIWAVYVTHSIAKYIVVTKNKALTGFQTWGLCPLELVFQIWNSPKYQIKLYTIWYNYVRIYACVYICVWTSGICVLDPHPQLCQTFTTHPAFVAPFYILVWNICYNGNSHGPVHETNIWASVSLKNININIIVCLWTM